MPDYSDDYYDRLEAIEDLLGEDFATLAEAERALEEEATFEPESAEEYDAWYDSFDEYEDQGEVDTSPDYAG